MTTYKTFETPGRLYQDDRGGFVCVVSQPNAPDIRLGTLRRIGGSQFKAGEAWQVITDYTLPQVMYESPQAAGLALLNAWGAK